jgi:hypothetical protein
LAQLNIDWENLSTLTPAVVSGETGSTPGSIKVVDDKGNEFDWSQPTVVWVYEDSPKPGAYDTVNEVIFKNEKVALGMKAFRRVRMSESQAAADAIVSSPGATAPRFILLDKTNDNVEIVEDNKKTNCKLSATTLYNAMQKVTKSAYIEKIDSVVKEHIKVLNEVDKLVNEAETLQDKLARAREAKNPSEKVIAKIEADIAENLKGQSDYAQKQIDMWSLTPRKPRNL